MEERPPVVRTFICSGARADSTGCTQQRQSEATIMIPDRRTKAALTEPLSCGNRELKEPAALMDSAIIVLAN